MRPRITMLQALATFATLASGLAPLPGQFSEFLSHYNVRRGKGRGLCSPQGNSPTDFSGRRDGTRECARRVRQMARMTPPRPSRPHAGYDGGLA